MRLHGRNAQTWQAKGLRSAAERFNYLYSDEELAALASPVSALQGKARRVHVLFINCYADKGVRNAATFREMLQA